MSLLNRNYGNIPFERHNARLGAGSLVVAENSRSAVRAREAGTLIIKNSKLRKRRRDCSESRRAAIFKITNYKMIALLPERATKQTKQKTQCTSASFRRDIYPWT